MGQTGSERDEKIMTSRTFTVPHFGHFAIYQILSALNTKFLKTNSETGRIMYSSISNIAAALRIPNVRHA